MKKFFENIWDNKIFFWSCFGLIILFAMGLRLTIIDFSLWYDEGCSIATAIQTFPQGITQYLWNHDLQHTPFYFYILHFIMQIFGDSTVCLRISSLIVSMAVLPITYIVAEKLSSKKVALFAMLLMAVNTFQVLYSIEIRMYPYVILLSLLSINYLIDYDRNGDKASLIKLGVVNVLNPYFLTGSIVFVIAEFIIYSIYLDYKNAGEEKMSEYVKSNLFVVLCYIPYFIFIGHYAIVRSKFLFTDLTDFIMMNLWGTLQNFVGADAGHIHETRYENFPNTWQSYLLIFSPIVLMFIGLFNSLKDKEKLNHVILGIISLCFVIFIFLAQSKTVAFTGRYLIFITPFIFILMAIGISKFNKVIVSVIVFFFIISNCYGLATTYKSYKNIAEFSLKSPADFCKANYSDKDNLVIMPFASSVSFYYFKGDNMPRVMPLEFLHFIRNGENTEFYSPEQIKALKTQDKYKVFQEIILKDDYISPNFREYLDSYISSVPKGKYIIWVVYYSDNYAILRPEVVKKIYSNYDNVKRMATNGMISKFDLDLVSILEQRAEFVTKTRDASNQFFVFRRK